MLTITRALLRAVRTHHWSARRPLILALGVLLAVGTVAAFPVTAYAAAPEARTALHAGVDDSGPFVVSGANVLLGTHRSTNSGASWISDPTLAATTWMTAVDGKLVGYTTNGTSYTAVVYTIATGAQATYPLPAAPVSMNGTWSLAYSGTYSAYNFLAGGSSVAVPAPNGAGVTIGTARLTPTSDVLWTGNLNTAHPAYAVAGSPSLGSLWVTIDGSTGAVATPSLLVYVLATTTAVQICSRPLANMLAAATCSTVMTGSYDSVIPQFSNFALWTVVNIWAGLGGAGTYTPYIWSGTKASKITLPSGSYLDQPTSAGADQYGDTPYAMIRDANTVPTIQRVMADGSLTTGFPLPTTTASSVGYLSVAPDRVVGADTRDGSLSLPTWTRTVSASGFGTETVLPMRSSGLKASAARTVVSGPAGLSVYDKDVQKPTIADAHVSQLSGPYLTRLGWNTTAQGPEVEVATVSNTTVAKFLGIAGTLFGSEYVTWTGDAAPTGSAHVVVNDLTGSAAPRSLTLPAGTAVCGGGRVWNSTLYMTCGSTKLQAFSLATGALLTTLNATGGPFVNLLDVGDGYAIVTFNNTDYSLWNTATGTLLPLTDCGNDVTSDGVGQVACSSTTQLIWRDLSSVSTTAPRLLGTVATATADFSDAGNTWSVDFDATKPLNAGTLVITKFDGTDVRTIVTPASADGSIRATWDGFDQSNKPVPAGNYTYKLTVTAADGSGTVTAVDGAAITSGKLTITSANPAGMSPGALLSVSPSRLLDTRTTGSPIPSATTRTLKVTGVGGVPSTGVSAVVLNVTVTETNSTGYLTVSPTGTTRPLVSNLNWSPGATIPNAVTVKVGANGYVDLYQSGPGTAQVIVDVAGYYVGGTVLLPGGFTALAPTRILDSRNTGGAFLASQTRDLQITGAGGVPGTGVSAVVLNVTVTETTANGYLTVFPAGTARPNASNLNWSTGLTIPNAVVVKVGTGGKVSIFQSGAGAAQVIVDVAGYYLDGSATLPGMFVALAPARVLDTRSTGAIPAASSLTLPMLGKGGLPTTRVAAVVINTTVTDPKAPGYLTVFPATNPLPTASNLNWSAAGTTIPNLVTVQVGTDGSIKFYNGSWGTSQVVVDTAGYYIGS